MARRRILESLVTRNSHRAWNTRTGEVEASTKTSIGPSWRFEVILNFSLLNDNAVGFVLIPLPSPAFFCTKRIWVNVLSGRLGRQYSIAMGATRSRTFFERATAGTWLQILP